MKGNVMAVNYNPLWHLLIEKDMKKKNLRELTGISTNTMAKLGKNQDVSTSIISKICTALECKVEDVMEFVPDVETEE
jgi:DNA-binding Xre family transcriptional regulator